MGANRNPPRNRTIAVASGKGGVGKSVITANLAVSLAQQICDPRSPVVAVDLDLGCGNLNACLGVRSHNGTVNNYLLTPSVTLEQIMTPTEQENLHMICSSYSGSPEMELPQSVKENLLREAESLDASFVLLDLGAGTSADVLDLFLGAHERVMVVTPEALSLHNAFVFVKSAIVRFLWRELGKEDFLSALHLTWQQLIDDPEQVNIRRSLDQIRTWDRYAYYVLRGLISELRFKFVVNMYREESEDAHIRNFYQLLGKYLCLNRNLGFLGTVHYEHGVRKSVQGVKPFLLSYPDNRAAADIREVAKRLARDEELNWPWSEASSEEVRLRIRYRRDESAQGGGETQASPLGAPAEPSANSDAGKEPEPERQEEPGQLLAQGSDSGAVPAAVKPSSSETASGRAVEKTGEVVPFLKPSPPDEREDTPEEVVPSGDRSDERPDDGSQEILDVAGRLAERPERASKEILDVAEQLKGDAC